MGRRTGASHSELLLVLQAVDAGFTSLGVENLQQQEQDGESQEDAEEEHRRQAVREECDAERPAAATRGR
jgi:hypothetical protein